MHVLTLTFPDAMRVEVHMMNPGETFPGFGGSRTGLTVRKTASLITRRISAMGTVDTELDIGAPGPWQTIANLINSAAGATAHCPLA